MEQARGACSVGMHADAVRLNVARAGVTDRPVIVRWRNGAVTFYASRGATAG